jgi:hypothetical protein
MKNVVISSRGRTEEQIGHKKSLICDRDLRDKEWSKQSLQMEWEQGSLAASRRRQLSHWKSLGKLSISNIELLREEIEIRAICCIYRI